MREIEIVFTALNMLEAQLASDLVHEAILQYHRDCRITERHHIRALAIRMGCKTVVPMMVKDDWDDTGIRWNEPE